MSSRNVCVVQDEKCTKSPNKILSLLSAEDVALIAPHLERVELQREDVLFEASEPIQYVYFLEDGLSSDVAINPDGNRIEAGCIGLEGVTSAPVILGIDRTPHRSFMQVGAPALRVKSSDLRDLMAVSFTLTALLLRYVHVFMIQVAATALADGRYKVEQRLARWLLMSQDRLGNSIPLTHNFLSLMLGVRRPSVTDALHVLEGHRFIAAARSLITIKDRHGLEALAGDAYGLPETEYRRLITASWPANRNLNGGTTPAQAEELE
jgi:CRP-like cAMP-binding protein